MLNREEEKDGKVNNRSKKARDTGRKENGRQVGAGDERMQRKKIA